MKPCLYCYEAISQERAGEKGYHYSCSQKFFQSSLPPRFAYSKRDIEGLALEVVKSRFTLTGVQAKLSLNMERSIGSKPARLTIIGVPGDFILKPQSEEYRFLPEIEHLSMRLATLAKIQTVPHTLISLKDASLAYLTRRIDRKRFRNTTHKIHMEDMCQLTGRLTEDKYKGSYEQVAKVIKKYSANPMLDVVNFYELLVFSFLIGNADMHLKNFSLIRDQRFSGRGAGYILSPAYDLVSTALALDDDEESALTLNGKKSKITKEDFRASMSRSGMNEKSMENIFSKFETSLPLFEALIGNSFLPPNLKDKLMLIINQRSSVLF